MGVQPSEPHLGRILLGGVAAGNTIRKAINELSTPPFSPQFHHPSHPSHPSPYPIQQNRHLDLSESRLKAVRQYSHVSLEATVRKNGKW